MGVAGWWSECPQEWVCPQRFQKWSESWSNHPESSSTYICHMELAREMFLYVWDRLWYVVDNEPCLTEWQSCLGSSISRYYLFLPALEKARDDVPDVFPFAVCADFLLTQARLAWCWYCNINIDDDDNSDQIWSAVQNLLVILEHSCSKPENTDAAKMR